jgi:hypothetical protein
MVTGTAALVTPPALAVMVALPESGLPDVLRPLQLINCASQTPAHTSPVGDTVTNLLFEVEKVGVAATAVPAEFCGVAIICSTCPELSESPVGDTITCVTAFAVVVVVPFPPP